MTKVEYRFSSSKVDYYFDASFSYLNEITGSNNTILITDENLFQLHHQSLTTTKQ
jgi:hypothetical protein